MIVYERLMYDQIDAYFKVILSKFQCSFREGCRAQYCLLVLIKKRRKFLDKDGFSGILMTNFSKAFDCIDYDKIESVKF